MPHMQSPPGPRVVIDGRPCLYFAGTGYLGLQGDGRLIEAACQATRQYGLHPATSRGGVGDNPCILDVEREAARFLGADDAFYFASGYLGSTILLQGLADRFDVLVVDEAAHYSVRDAARGAGKPVRLFPHGDADGLRDALRPLDGTGARPLVMCDGVSPVLGDIAPLPDYLAVLESVGGAGLYLDDAHALGVLGERGRGTFEHWAGMRPDVAGRLAGVNEQWEEKAKPPSVGLWQSATLSKAVGGFGGIIAGSRAFIAHLKGATAWHHGASAPPAGAAAASATGLEIARTQPALRRQLRDNAAYLKNGLRGIGLNVNESPVPIICLQQRDAAAMQAIQQRLAARDIIIAYIKSYSGLSSEGALRIAVFAGHTKEMIDQLIAEMGEAMG